MNTSRTALTTMFGLATLTTACSMCGGQTWDANADFSASHGNPNGTWTYGWYPSNLSGAINVYSRSLTPPNVPLWGAWIGGDSTPAVWLNTTGTTQNQVTPGQLSLHPGPGGEACAVQWTNPQADRRGSLQVTGRFFSGDGGVMQVGVRVNNTLIFAAADAGSFDLSLNNRESQSIEFVVYGAYAYGNTPLDAMIAFVPFCPGDFNLDGGVDGSDVDAFFAAWESGDSASDINEDGGVDGADVATFFARWEAGC
jgi:hypothetical protein